MQSGVLTTESFSELLRGISQRRRQGILEVLSREGRIELYFVAGRVVEAKRGELTSIQETVAWLNRGGYKCRNPEEYYDDQYVKLLETLSKEVRGITLQTLKSVISERVLETVYRLDLSERAMFSFHVQMVEVDKAFAPNLSVGQLLLDFVEIPDIRKSYESLTKEATNLSLVGKIPGDLSTSERQVIEAVKKSSSLIEIKAKSLLSEFQFMRTVVDLISQGVLVSQSVEEHPQKSVEIQDFVSSSVDKAFASEEKKANTIKKLGKEKADLYDFNNLLLKNELVPQVVALLFLIASLAVPLFSWGNLVRYFGQ